MSVVVRSADRRLVGDLADLHLGTALAAYRHIFPEDAPPPTKEEVQQQWAHWLGPDWDRGRRAFVAEDRSEDDGWSIVGVILAGPDPGDDDLGHLSRLYVAPDRWAEGIGGQLYRAAIDHLSGAGFAEATLWVLERNERARSWYERLGWLCTGERKSVYAPAGIEDVQYRIAL